MALSALSIDALLPGLRDIGNSLGISNPKENQLLVTMIFLGLGFGQLISGTLSDSLGRKPVVYIGYSLFAVASVVCVFSTSLEMMIIGRLLQGFGLSAPRSVSMAIIRDKYSGDYMARIMSFVTVIFILAPIVAPSFGKLMLDQFGWKSIFYSQVLFGLAVVIWLWRRQAETLKDENRKQITLALFIKGLKEFVKYKDALVYTLVVGIVSAPFLAYISASQTIFQEQYNLVNEYPYIFSGLAIAIGLATFLNGTLVVRFGMLRIASISMATLLLISTSYVLIFNGLSNPPVLVLVGFLGLMLFSTGFIVGNTSALAMQPIGHIAGIGSAIVGFVSTLITVPIATLIGTFINTTALPVFIGFAVCGMVSLLLILFVNSPKKRTVINMKRKLVYNFLNK